MQRSAGRLFCDVHRQCNTGSLEDISNLARSMGPGANELAVLLDGGLLEAIKIIEQRLPLRFQPFCFMQAGQFLGQREGQERAKHMTADRRIGSCPNEWCKFAGVAPATSG